MAKSVHFREFEDDYEIYIKDGAIQKEKMLKAISTYSDVYNCKFEQNLAIKVLPNSTENFETFKEVLNYLWAKKSKIDADEIISEDPSCLIPILEKCNNIKELKLSSEYSKEDFTEIIPIVVQNCPLIEVLNIPGILLSEKDLVHLKEFTALKMISINVDSTDAPLAELFANNLHLEHIEIVDREESINGICLRALPKSLQSLKLHNAHYLDLSVLTHCETISNLRFFTAHVFDRSSFLGDLINIAPNIEKLSLYTNRRQNYSALIKLKKLNSLTLSQLGPNLDQEDIKNIANNCPNLQILNLEHVNECITPESVKDLSKIRQLREIKLKEYRDSKFLYGSSFRNFSKFKNLEALHVYSSDITDNALLYAIEGCQKLRTIIIDQCRNVTSDLIYTAETEMKRNSSKHRNPITIIFDELNKGMYHYDEDISSKQYYLLNVHIKTSAV